MQSINKTLRAFAARLDGLSVPAHHYTVTKQATLPYVMWIERSAGSESYEDADMECIVQVELFFYTQKEFDPALDEIVQAFPELRLDSVDYIQDTRLIVYGFSLEVAGG